MNTTNKPWVKQFRKVYLKHLGAIDTEAIIVFIEQLVEMPTITRCAEVTNKFDVNKNMCNFGFEDGEKYDADEIENYCDQLTTDIASSITSLNKTI